ncbi:MAG TPA: TetR family transcriptional regulator [Polyangia bacterium]|nr:TetR family transcriptional regulator [Polyangia bacterium]
MLAMSKPRAAAKRRGRPSGAVPGESRGAILDAARQLFAKHGFVRTTTRAVAAKAGVDPAMVHYFFQNKAKLFAAAVEVPVSADELRAVLQEAIHHRRRKERGGRIIRFMLDHVFTPRADAIAALIRAAVGDAGSVPLLRSQIEKTVVAGAASAIGGPDGRLRAELLGAIVVGLFIVRQIVRVEPLASATPEEVSALIGPAVDAILGTA